jgi:uncharacterized protein (DUF433 family)
MNQDISSIIVCTPGVLGGRVRIDGTRVSVRSIVSWYKKGYTAEEISEQYEQLSLVQIYAALTSYYHANPSEIEASILAEESIYNQLMQEHYPLEKAA